MFSVKLKKSLKRHSSRGLLILLPVLLLLSCSQNKTQKYETVPTIPVTIRGYKLDVEIADTPEKVQRGLMYRKQLPAHRGMLFVYPVEMELSFWMKNTYLPLSIAFLDKSGRILNILEMKPLDPAIRYSSKGKAKYALEVNRGWFKERAIVPGNRVYFRIPRDSPKFDY